MACRAVNLAVRPWARNFGACVDCGSTEFMHKGKGLCLKCARRSLKVVRHCPRKRTGPKEGDALTKRELEILRQIAHGLTSAQIARQSGTEEKSVKNQRTDLFKKLGALNGAHAVTLHISNLAKTARFSETMRFLTPPGEDG